MNVYVISSGVVYEGGRINRVFVDKEKAHGYFEQLVEDKRAGNKEMYVWALSEESEYTRKNAEKWLEEEHIVNEKGDEYYVFSGCEYIELKIWIAE